MKSVLRTGRASKRFEIETVVPGFPGWGLTPCNDPCLSNVSEEATGSTERLVTIENCPLISHNAFNASPLNPNVDTEPKSEKRVSLDV